MDLSQEGLWVDLMIITCPSCATRFHVDPHVLGDEGRPVRCVLCSYTWFQAPAPDLPKRLPEFSEGEIVWPHRPDEQGENPTQTYCSYPPASSLKRIIGWVSLGMFILGIFATLYWAREPLVRVWPSLSSYYRLVGIHTHQPMRLVIENSSYRHQPKGDKTFLVVEGAVKNISPNKLRSPHIRIMGIGYGDCLMHIPKHLKKDHDPLVCIVMQWSFIAPHGIAPDEVIPFHTMAEEPSDAQIEDVILEAI